MREIVGFALVVVLGIVVGMFFRWIELNCSRFRLSTETDRFIRKVVQSHVFTKLAVVAVLALSTGGVFSAMLWIFLIVSRWYFPNEMGFAIGATVFGLVGIICGIRFGNRIWT